MNNATPSMTKYLKDWCTTTSDKNVPGQSEYVIAWRAFSCMYRYRTHAKTYICIYYFTYIYATLRHGTHSPPILFSVKRGELLMRGRGRGRSYYFFSQGSTILRALFRCADCNFLIHIYVRFSPYFHPSPRCHWQQCRIFLLTATRIFIMKLHHLWSRIYSLVRKWREMANVTWNYEPDYFSYCIHKYLPYLLHLSNICVYIHEKIDVLPIVPC